MAYYQNWVTEHPSKDEIIRLICNELRPAIIRLRNSYDLQGDGVSSDMKCDSKLFEACKANLEQPPLVVLAAWSPPARFKHSGSTTGARDGTHLCACDAPDDRFVYRDVAKWWLDSFHAYEQLGVDVWSVSIQNELNFSGGHDCCLFSLTETDHLPGYDRYIKATRSLFHRQISSPPVFLGPEHTAMDGDLPDGQLADQIDIIGNHLYGSGDFDCPQSLLPSIKNAGCYAFAHKKPLFMSEYASLRDHQHEDPLKLATTIHNCLVYANVGAYLQWDLFWGAGTGQGTLLLVDNPFDSHDKFCNPKGFTTTMSFYWFAHFSRFIRPGYHRVAARSNKQHILVSAYSGPSANFTVVLINTCGDDVTEFECQGIPGGARDAHVYQSTLDQQLQDLGEFGGTIACLPARSITTISTAP